MNLEWQTEIDFNYHFAYKKMSILNNFLLKILILAAPVRLELTTHGLTVLTSHSKMGIFDGKIINFAPFLNICEPLSHFLSHFFGLRVGQNYSVYFPISRLIRANTLDYFYISQFLYSFFYRRNLFLQFFSHFFDGNRVVLRYKFNYSSLRL